MPSSQKALGARVPSAKAAPPSQSKNAPSNGPNGSYTAKHTTPSGAQEMQTTPRMWTYRVRGIPKGLDWEATASLLQSTLKLRDWELQSLAPDPVREKEQVATFEVLQPPYGALGPRPGSEWQFSIPSSQCGNANTSNSRISQCNHSLKTSPTPESNSQGGKTMNRNKKSTVTVDKHFLGLTPLNCSDESQSFIE